MLELIALILMLFIAVVVAAVLFVCGAIAVAIAVTALWFTLQVFVWIIQFLIWCWKKEPTYGEG